MREVWKRRGLAASFVVFLLAGSGCGPKEATVRPDRAARAKRRLREMPVEELLPVPEAEPLEEPLLPAVRETEAFPWTDVEPAAQPEEEVAAPAEEEGEAEPPVVEEGEEPVAEDEGGEAEEEAVEPAPAEEDEAAEPEPPAEEEEPAPPAWNWE